MENLTYYRACFYVEGANAPWRTELVLNLEDLMTSIDDECARLVNEGLFESVRSVDIERDTLDWPLAPLHWFKGPWSKPRALLREVRRALEGKE